MAPSLNPFVYWAQSETQLFLKIDLKDVKKPRVNFESRRVQFECKGVGAQGDRWYGFAIDLYSNINTEECLCKIQASKVEITAVKSEKRWWPRLTSVQKKPVWLKTDFERWQSEDDLNSADEQVRDVREDYDDLYRKLQKEEIGYTKEDLLTVYLVIYNILMCVGFTYVASVMSVKYIRDGIYCYKDVYETIAVAMQYLNILQLLEIVMALYGVTGGGLMASIVQIGGRFVMIFYLIAPEHRLYDQPVVFYLYFAYCLSEIIRYPYYVTQVLKTEYYILTWLRYTAWILLYPIGLTSEAIIIYKSIIYLDETHRFSISMPNWYNFSFSLAIVLRTYLLLFFLPTVYLLISHMYRGRRKRLNSKRWIEKEN